MPRRDKDAAENPISTNLRAWQGQAESCPPTCASVRSGGLSGVCSDVACRSVHVCFAVVATQNAGKPTPRLGGCAPPPPPRPLSLGRQRKGGKKARPWRTSQGFCPRRATPSLRICPRTGIAGVARTDPRPKALPPACARQGQKKRRAGHPAKKNAQHIEL